MQNQRSFLTADEIAYSSAKHIPLTDHHDYQNDPEFQHWLKDLTDEILDGVFPRTQGEENLEVMDYLNKHRTKKLDCSNKILMLFEPPETNKEKFEECVSTLYSKIDQEKDYSHKKIYEHPSKLYCNYFYNEIQDLKDIFGLIDDIKEKETLPLKIDFDCGFIVEDSKENTYEVSTASEENLGKTVPMIIRTAPDFKLYKHLVFATLGEYTNEVHVRKGGSRFHYIAIHSIMFQVTRLKDSGAKFLVPGYDFLVKNKYIIDYGNDYNLCMFYVVANTKK